MIVLFALDNCRCIQLFEAHYWLDVQNLRFSHARVYGIRWP